MLSPARRAMSRLAACLFAAAPVLFGTARAIQTRTDFRYLVVALATLTTVVIVMLVRRNDHALTPGRAVLAFVAASFVGSGLAFAQGAKSISAVIVVALAFAGCATLAVWLGFGTPSAKAGGM